MISFFKAITLLVALMTTVSVTAQQAIDDFLSDHSEEICYFVGEMALPAISTTAFAVCLEGVPAACTLGYSAMECASDPACSWVVSEFTSRGCTYALRKVGDTLVFMGKASRDHADSLKKTYESLNTVAGMRWLMRRLSQ